LKSTMRSPLGARMYASSMFHSSGIVQSKQRVPVGNSCTARSGAIRFRYARVARTPLPVRLRQIGKRSLAQRYISAWTPIWGSPAASVPNTDGRVAAVMRSGFLVQHQIEPHRRAAPDVAGCASAENRGEMLRGKPEAWPD